MNLFRNLTALSLVLCTACGVDSTTAIDGDDVNVTELDAPAEVSQEVQVDVLNVAPQELDVAPGTFDGRVTRVLTSAAAARAVLGPALPSVSFTRNWLIAYRPEGKSPQSRVEVTRAQLSSTGTTLSLWATVTEPGAGCTAWRPNEVSVVRVPSRAKAPTSVRVFVTRATTSCGLTVGPTCVPSSALAPLCPQTTPFCLGTYERPDGTFTNGTCVKFAVYDGSSAACTTDAACGAGGICAGLALSPGGLCQPSWMRGTYSMPVSGQLSVPLPRDGSWRRVVVPVSAQATVPMDAWLQVFIDGDARNARVRLVNPYGTTSSTWVPLAMGLRAPVAVPGDEVINGEWVVELQDVGTTGAPAVFRGARLSVTSRWD